MNFDFSEKINNFLKIILKNAQEQNLRVFFVGGIVRDKILNIETKDIDLLLLGNAIEFSKKLPEIIKIKSIHKDFATVKLQYDNIEIDIASSRSEKYPYSGCLPVVEKVGVPLEKDVKRRDFTVNSLYCELNYVNDEIKYELIDFVGGLNDIKNKTLKVLHNNSYIDDPTRIIRGLGFKYRFNFDFSLEDKQLISQYLDNIDYSNMSFDRNLKVFKYVLNNDFQDEIFKEIIKHGYYKIINSNIIDVDFEKIKKIKLNSDEKIQFYIDIMLDKPVSLEKLNTKLEIYKHFSRLKRSDIAYYFYKTNDENVLEFEKIKNIELFVNGFDLLNLGFKQGNFIGIILDNLFQEKLENPEKFLNKNQEIAWILNRFPQN